MEIQTKLKLGKAQLVYYLMQDHTTAGLVSSLIMKLNQLIWLGWLALTCSQATYADLTKFDQKLDRTWLGYSTWQGFKLSLSSSFRTLD